MKKLFDRIMARIQGFPSVIKVYRLKGRDGRIYKIPVW